MLVDAVYAPAPLRGLLRLTGADRVAFLHNMTTSHIKRLAVGECAPTAIVNQRGQVLDWVDVLADTDALWVVTGPGKRDDVLAWLDKYLITEDVTLTPDETPLTFVTGVDAAAVIQNLPRVFPTTGYGGPGYLVAGTPETVAAKLRGAGAQAIQADALEDRRIAAGVPTMGHELTEKVNPWEARLDASISLDKGCYLGQEIVARLQAYDKVQRLLSGLRVPLGAAVGDPLFLDEKAIGEITSIGAQGSALGYVRRSALEAGATISWRTEKGELFPVPILDRWFWRP